MYRVLVFPYFVSCWLLAQSTSLTCQMEDDNPVDVTVASILAHLQAVSSRDEQADKLYGLAQALESPPSRERQSVLRRLCSGTEWNIGLRADGKNKTIPAIEQELKTAAMRAYVALRARENASQYGAGGQSSAQPPGAEETHSKDPPAVMQTAHGAQGASSSEKRRAKQHDDLPHNKKSVLRLLQGAAVPSSSAGGPSQGHASGAPLRQDSLPAASERAALKRLSAASGQQQESPTKSVRSMSSADASSAAPADDGDASSSDGACEVVFRCVACDRHGCNPEDADQVPRCPFFGRARGQLSWNASASALRDSALGDNVPHFAQATVRRLATSVFLINEEKYKLGASPPDGNNCLIHALKQCCSAVSWSCRADVAAVRLSLQNAFPAGGAHEVVAANFLTLDVHWKALLQSMLDVGQDVVLVSKIWIK